MNALNSSPTLKSEDIRYALSKTNGYRCAAGVFSFDKDGNPISAINVATIKDGKIVPAYTTTTPTNAEGMIKIKTVN